MTVGVGQAMREGAEQYHRTATGPESGPDGGEAALLDSEEIWHQFAAERTPTSFFYSPTWCRLLAEVFGHSFYCLSTQQAEKGRVQVTGVLPLVHVRSRIFGSRLVSLPFCNWGGPIGSGRAEQARLVFAARKLARSLGASNLEIRADQELECDAPARRHKVRMVLNLPESRESFQASLAAKVRSQARRPLRAGATFHIGGSAEVDTFYSVFARNMRDLGTPVLPRRFFRELVRRFADEVCVALVMVDGRPAAAGILVRNGTRMEIPWAASLREANRLGVNMLLYSEAIGHAIEAGCTEFDFGRSTEGSGTYKFKRQWGAQPEALFWYAWHDDKPDMGPGLSPDNPGFGLAIRVWQRLPVWLTRILGPRLARNLP